MTRPNAPRWLPLGNGSPAASMLDPASGSSARVYCFPHAGASAAVYAPWRGLAGDRLAICPVQPPGRAERFREKPFTTVDSLVDELVADIGDQFTGNYAFFGHSMGALVAFEVTRKLRAIGAQLPKHLFVSGRAAPQLPDTRKQLRALPQPELIAELKRLGGMPDAVLNEPELLELFIPLFRADLTVNEAYTHRSEEPLPIPLTTLGGHGDPRADDDELKAWGELTADRFALHTYPGGHFYLEKKAGELIDMFAAELG
ncbi:alpha/beta fold hydrolase [Allokutzneria sp. A3M-2-11 16]|uniref:thioesterase II family protein n=1 Tax=Allokutzneria sp. A3M-2-11 16 TaxID=2962043 RepID=UPI0020B81347|nr:alpha/beta fold hydrolase [Allokutzneria sp. A3M-2-11 16]MCP3804700.1 alpha/beta fold hydrolase [Allokutzneria sp. A3M-2-11 16]